MAFLLVLGLCNRTQRSKGKRIIHFFFIFASIGVKAMIAPATWVVLAFLKVSRVLEIFFRLNRVIKNLINSSTCFNFKKCKWMREKILFFRFFFSLFSYIKQRIRTNYSILRVTNGKVFLTRSCDMCQFAKLSLVKAYFLTLNICQDLQIRTVLCFSAGQRCVVL